ncbi:hypothetical protein [Algoriphagus litoralis]|nr:hypothetical protein [Algoriphagus litoralis]
MEDHGILLSGSPNKAAKAMNPLSLLPCIALKRQSRKPNFYLEGNL